MTGTLTILACSRCGATIALNLVPTASPACQSCGAYGSVELHRAIVVEAIVPPAERYPWTPYLELAAA